MLCFEYKYRQCIDIIGRNYCYASSHKHPVSELDWTLEDTLKVFLMLLESTTQTKLL